MRREEVDSRIKFYLVYRDVFLFSQPGFLYQQIIQ